MSLFLLLQAAEQPRTASFAVTETGADTAAITASSQTRSVSFAISETGADSATAVAYNNPRYWVGGTGTWNTTSTTNWALTSGGASGASVPTASTSVIFNAASNSGTTAFTVTTTNSVSCLDFVIDSPDGVLTFASGSTPTTNIYGDLLLQSTNVTWSITHTVRFQGTGNHHTITTAGIALNHVASFQGSGTYTLLDNWTSTSLSGDINHTAGTLSFNNFNVTTADFTSTGSTTRVLNMGSGTLLCSGAGVIAVTFSGSNLTINPGSSLLKVAPASASTVSLGGYTFHDVEISAISTGIVTLANTFTCVNLNLNNNAGTGSVNTTQIQMPNGTITVTGAFSATGLDQRRRLFLRVGLVNDGLCTVNAASVGTISDADFAGVIGSGAAAPFTGTRVGNGGNSASGITFDSPRTVYWRGSAGTSNSANATCPFALTSTGALTSAAYPLPQDTVVINEDSLPSTYQCGSVNAPLSIQTFNCSARTTAATVTTSSSGFQFTGTDGSLILSSAITVSNASGPTSYIYATDSFSITSAGVALNMGPLVQRQYNGGQSVLPVTRLLGATSHGDATTTAGIQQESGRLDLNGHNLTLYNYQVSNSGQTTAKRCELWFGSGRFIVSQRTTSATQITLTNASNFLMQSGKYIELDGGSGTTGPTISPQNTTSAPASFSANGRNGVASFKLTATLNITALTWNSGGVNGLDMSQYALGAGFTSNLSAPVYFYGDVTLSSFCTVPASTNQIQWVGQDGGNQNLNANGATINAPLRFGLGATDTLTLTGNLTLSSAKNWTLVTGTFNLGSYIITSAGVEIGGTSARTLNFGSGTVVTSGGFTANPAVNLTLAGASTGKLKLTHASGTIVDMGSCASKWPTIEVASSAITNFLTTASQSVYNVYNSVYGTQIYFGSNTFTFDLFQIRGQASSPQVYEYLTIFDAGGAVSKASGIVDCDYLRLDTLPALGGASWYAGANSVDLGGNTNWIFAAAVRNLTGNNVNQAATSTTGAVTVSGGTALTANNVTQTNQSTSGAINQAHVVLGNNVSQTNRSTAGTVSQSHVLSANNVNQAAISATGAISQTHKLSGNSVSQAATTTTGAVVQIHKPAGNNVSQVNSLQTGAVSQTHRLTGNSVVGTPTTATGAITQLHKLFGASVIGTPVVSTGAISQLHRPSGNSVQQANQATVGAISQIHRPAGASVNQTNIASTGAVSQTHRLSANAVSQENNSTNGSIGQAGDVLGANVAQRNQSTSGSITQTHKLSGANVFQRSVCTTGAVSSGALTGQNVNQTNTATTAAVSQIHRLAANSVNQPKQTTTGSVGQIHRLSGAASHNAQVSSAASVSQLHRLSGAFVSQVNKTTSGSVGSTVVLTGANVVGQNQTTTGSVAVVITLTGESVFQRNRSGTGAISQIHALLGLNLNQTAASAAGFVVVEGNILGAACFSEGSSTSGAIEVFEVVSAPAGAGYFREMPNTRRPSQINTKRPDRLLSN